LTVHTQLSSEAAVSTSKAAWQDDCAELFAAFALGNLGVADATTIDATKRILIDTLAVGLGAFHHPAAEVARRYLALFPSDPRGVGVWGTSLRASPEKATLVNGVPLRCYDYNDVFFGRAGGGHPSDMLSALLAAAEWRNASGSDLLHAIAVAYEIAAALYDTVPADRQGWDHANLTALGATCGVARLFGLTHEQTLEALAIAAIEHLQSDEIESSALNRRGDLTMWKRFHGGDAMRHAIDACLLASVGAEGAIRPFQGRLGLFAKFGLSEDPTPALRDLLKGGVMRRIGDTTMKRWPVGSRAQSAIAATLAARTKLASVAAVREVRVYTEEPVYHHLVRIRTNPWTPISRETADHSLPYIVGSAVLDGFINTTSFDLGKVFDPERQRFIASCVKVEIDPGLPVPSDGKSRLISRVEIKTHDGPTLIGEPLPPPGHKENPLTAADLADKLHENADTLLGEARVARLIDLISRLDQGIPARELTAALVVESAQRELAPAQ
jgi:2-methylcitrate dehydratase